MPFCFQANQRDLPHEKTGVTVAKRGNNREVEKEMLLIQTEKNIAELQKETEDREQKEVRLHKM